MHQFHKGIERRLRALEQRLGAVVEPETAAATARRLELVKAAHLDLQPANLTATEKLTFSRIRASVPIFEELIADGLVDGLLDETGDDPHRDDLDEDGDGELSWSP